MRTDLLVLPSCKSSLIKGYVCIGRDHPHTSVGQCPRSCYHNMSGAVVEGGTWMREDGRDGKECYVIYDSLINKILSLFYLG